MSEARVYTEDLIRQIGLDRIMSDGEDISIMTPDQEKGLHWAITECLSPREGMVIREKYLYRFTWKELAEKWDASDTCIQQVAREALEKLRNPYVLDYILDGYDAHVRKWTALCDELEDMFRREQLSRNDLEELYQGPVRNLNLDSKTEKALEKNGITDVCTLVWMVQWKYWWDSLRRFGHRSAMKTLESLYASGLLPAGIHQLELPKEGLPYLEWKTFSLSSLNNAILGY